MSGPKKPRPPGGSPTIEYQVGGACGRVFEDLQSALNYEQEKRSKDGVFRAIEVRYNKVVETTWAESQEMIARLTEDLKETSRQLELTSNQLYKVEREAKAQHEIVHRSSNIIRDLEQKRDDLMAALRDIAAKLGEHEGKGDKRAGELIIDAFYKAQAAIAAAERPAQAGEARKEV